MAEADERTRRIGLNEALFRQVNESIQKVGEELAAVEEEPGHQILCECGDTDCTEQVSIDPSRYEQVRSDPTLFIVARGHIAPDVEEVAADGGPYQIVRKRPGAPQEIAEATDPRDS
jgi:hypothetical protein